MSWSIGFVARSRSHALQCVDRERALTLQKPLGGVPVTVLDYVRGAIEGLAHDTPIRVEGHGHLAMPSEQVYQVSTVKLEVVPFDFST